MGMHQYFQSLSNLETIQRAPGFLSIRIIQLRRIHLRLLKSPNF
ncbi:Nucleotidase YfbR HD superfamily [Lactiplantibacillus plantarum]|uniref:Nucleotidase YfbR HD superfamily n=1 Tax=Lactiplantibacillus plantarum TaxID=1590 RepID=A0AAW3RAW5_LACPN|nr:Nucleotidase YfbR HD superfamily [Lactiplantibacillus plantarum]KZV01650.1 Nucleotidase YfbR HD superfamily [Lactiplantibacillus plantarum]